MCSSAVFFFLMIRRPPRSTLDRSSAASDVYKRQGVFTTHYTNIKLIAENLPGVQNASMLFDPETLSPVSYTHLRAHETVLDLVCRLLLEKKKQHNSTIITIT